MGNSMPCFWGRSSGAMPMRVGSRPLPEWAATFSGGGGGGGEFCPQRLYRLSTSLSGGGRRFHPSGVGVRSGTAQAPQECPYSGKSGCWGPEVAGVIPDGLQGYLVGSHISTLDLFCGRAHRGGHGGSADRTGRGL